MKKAFDHLNGVKIHQYSEMLEMASAYSNKIKPKTNSSYPHFTMMAIHVKNVWDS